MVNLSLNTSKLRSSSTPVYFLISSKVGYIQQMCIRDSLAAELEKLGYRQLNKDYFDTLKIELPAHVSVNALREIALECKVNLRYFEGGQVGISIDETTQPTDIGVLLYIFAGAAGKDYMLEEAIPEKTYFDQKFARTSDFLQEEMCIRDR